MAIKRHGRKTRGTNYKNLEGKTTFGKITRKNAKRVEGWQSDAMDISGYQRRSW